MKAGACAVKVAETPPLSSRALVQNSVGSEVWHGDLLLETGGFSRGVGRLRKDSRELVRHQTMLC